MTFILPLILVVAISVNIVPPWRNGDFSHTNLFFQHLNDWSMIATVVNFGIIATRYAASARESVKRFQVQVAVIMLASAGVLMSIARDFGVSRIAAMFVLAAFLTAVGGLVLIKDRNNVIDDSGVLCL